MLTKNDLSQIKLLITAGSSRVISEVEELKDEIKEVKRGVKLLPTKEEYFDSMDKLMGEVEKSRQEQTVIGENLSLQGDRIEKLEEKVGITSPS